MELQVSDKVSGFSKRPRIKKGYYPGKFVSVEERKTSEGVVYEGKFGTQIIMEFAVFNANEQGTPTTPIKYTEENEGRANFTKDLILPKFVYSKYKDQKTNELKTAVTPNSAITKIFMALGWEFDVTKPLNVSEFIGKWAELNIDDYDAKIEEDGQTVLYKASTIKDISKYEGNKVSGEVDSKAEQVKVSNEPQVIKKQLNHEDVGEQEEAVVYEDVEGDKPSSSDLSTEIEETKKKLKELKDTGNLTEEGYNQAIEQLNKRLEVKK